MDKKKTIDEIMSNLEDLKTVKNGYEILGKINEIHKLNEHIHPTGIALILHKEKLAEFKDDPKLYAIKLKNKSDVISKKCRMLENLGLIEEQKIIGQKNENIKNYMLTLKGEELLANYSQASIEAEYNKMKESSPKTQTKQYVNDYHTYQIRSLIRRIIKGIPKVYDNFVSLDFNQEFQRIYAGDRLPFEDDLLYSDLSNHIGTFISYQELQDRIEVFKQKGTELPDLKNRIKDAIRHDLFTTLNLEYDPNCVLIDTFSNDLVDWVHKGIVYHIENGRSEDYQQLFIDPRFQTETSSDTVTIRIGVDILMKVSKGSENQKLSQLKDYMNQIEDQIPFRSVLDLMSHRKELIQIRNLIIESLMKENMLPGFSGKCIYS